MDEGVTSTGDPERCIKQYALTVAMNAKFHSSLQKAGPFTAETAIRSIDHREDGKNQNYFWIAE
jgi:hypothetical protein